MGTKETRPGSFFGRRELLAGGGMLATSALLPHPSAGAAASGVSLQEGTNLYTQLGVRPLINCKGTFTIITGSQTLPEVKEAMFEASRHYVHLDELMEAVGKRLSDLTGADWGIVTAGCSAAETLATCACVAGGDPEKIQRLPNLEGLKDEVIIPRYSRNVYDHAIRMVGVRIVEAENMEQLQDSMGPRTAMIYILACPEDQGRFGLEPIAEAARKRDVSVFVDAAAEGLTPEIHLRRGADLVAYSGGKALRGPQCAGLLLGNKKLCQAAWLHSAPHHAFGRSMKVGKEEIMGMLAAAEMWYQRDHKAEWKVWESWLDVIARGVASVPGVSTEVLQPGSLSNYSPRLAIRWDGNRFGVSGEEVYQLLLNGKPRIILAAGRGRFRNGMEKSSVEVMPWMMKPGDAEIVTGSLREVLSSPPQMERRDILGSRAASVSGRWEATLEFVLGQAGHTFHFEQEGEKLVGTHHTKTLSGPLRGSVDENRVEFTSSQSYEGARFRYRFSGDVSDGSMSGEVDLGEYGMAHWSAHRYDYG
jgi:D-glucosaminate-6-phosphate ammonia-lyase